MENRTTEIPRQLTYGEKAVGLTFNHGEGEIHDAIHYAKATCAAAIDQMYAVMMQSNDENTGYPLGFSRERGALSMIAIRALQSAQMDMVKAITWKD